MAEHLERFDEGLGMASLEKEQPPPYTPLPVRLFTIQPCERKLWPTPISDTPQIQINGSSRQGPGRPPTKFNSGDERKLIRIFVNWSKQPFERISTAIVNSNPDGPKRLAIRNIFHDLTGAGPGSDMSLGEIRFSETNEGVKRVSAEQGSDQRVCPKCGLAGHEYSQASPQDRQGDAVRLLQDSQPDFGLASAVDHDVHGSGTVSEDTAAIESIEVPQASLSPMFQSPLQQATTPESSGQSITPSSGDADANDRNISRRQRNYRPRRRPRLVDLNFSAILRELDNGDFGPGHHFARCCSISESTMFSRMSSIGSVCYIGTKGSEFEMYYANPKPCERGVTSMSEQPSQLPDSNEKGTEALGGLLFNLLLEARLNSMSDEQLERKIIDHFGEECESLTEGITNHRDHHGVSALHLAVAYGFPKVCRLLMKHGAVHNARTYKRTCVNHFAKPAEKLAAVDSPLYARIKNCRKHVKKNVRPPAPNPKGKKRGRTTPSSSHDQHTQNPARTTTAPAPTSYVPSTTDDNGLYHATSPGGSILNERFTVSPAATLHSFPSTTNFQDFAAQPTGIGASPLLHRTLDQTLPFEPSPAFSMNGMVPFEFQRNFQGARPQQNPPGPSPLRAAVVPYATVPMDVPDQGRAVPLETLPSTPDATIPILDGQEGDILQPPFPPFSASHQFGQILPHVDMVSSEAALSRAAGWPSSFQPSTRNHDVALNGLRRPEAYAHCVHDAPRNYRISHCLSGCPKLEYGDIGLYFP